MSTKDTTKDMNLLVGDSGSKVLTIMLPIPESLLNLKADYLNNEIIVSTTLLRSK